MGYKNVTTLFQKYSHKPRFIIMDRLFISYLTEVHLVEVVHSSSNKLYWFLTERTTNECPSLQFFIKLRLMISVCLKKRRRSMIPDYFKITLYFERFTLYVYKYLRRWYKPPHQIKVYRKVLFLEGKLILRFFG